MLAAFIVYELTTLADATALFPFPRAVPGHESTLKDRLRVRCLAPRRWSVRGASSADSSPRSRPARYPRRAAWDKERAVGAGVASRGWLAWLMGEAGEVWGGSWNRGLCLKGEGVGGDGE